MTKAQVRLSEMTLQRIASGETVTIRIAEVAELSISKALPPGSPPQSPPADGTLLEKLFEKYEKGCGGLFDGIFGKSSK